MYGNGLQDRAAGSGKPAKAGSIIQLRDRGIGIFPAADCFESHSGAF